MGGLHISEPHFMNEINKQIMSNNAAAKRMRCRTATDLDAESASEAMRREAEEAEELARESAEHSIESSQSSQGTSSESTSSESTSSDDGSDAGGSCTSVRLSET